MAHGGFSGKHDGIHLFKDGVGNVRDFRTGRGGLGYHGFQHMRCHDAAASQPVAMADDAALDDGQFFNADFNAQVSTRDHDNVCGQDDIVNVADSLLVFNFCDDLGLASQVVDVFPELGNMGGIPDEGHGYVVRLAFYGHGQVRQVFFRQGREPQRYAGKVDVAAGAEYAFREHVADEPVRAHFRNAHEDASVIHHHGMARLNILQEAVIVYRGGKRKFRLGCAQADFHGVSLFQMVGFHQISRANGRPLEVKEDSYVRFQFRCFPADAEDYFPDPVVFGMAHVEPEDVGSGFNKLAQHVGSVCCWSNSTDDFGGPGPGRCVHGLCQCP